jgi:hypothetical protein
MTDLTTIKDTAKTDLATAELAVGTAVTDFRTLIANRIGDALIAGIVLAAIWIGHIL